ncbi:hypothetical protein ACFO0N_01130 [Halobium salinum]|uniref:Uncharacterized protein n=1 Tax=Halobium salinum TaxID=1364940 RepID=A0ABD5P7A6_9EURY|nr:hypothetical protein [Halobium salinum]
MDISLLATLFLVGTAPFAIVWVWTRKSEQSKNQKLQFTFSTLSLALGLILFSDLLEEQSVPLVSSEIVFGLMGVSLLLSVYFIVQGRKNSLGTSIGAEQ